MDFFFFFFSRSWNAEVAPQQPGLWWQQEVVDLLSQLLPWSQFSLLSNVKVLLKVLLTSDSISTSCADVSAFSLIWQLSSRLISIFEKLEIKHQVTRAPEKILCSGGIFFVDLNLLAVGLSTFLSTDIKIAHVHVKASWFGFASAISPSSLRFIHQNPTKSRQKHRPRLDLLCHCSSKFG